MNKGTRPNLQKDTNKTHHAFLTSLFRAQWNMKIASPWSELKTAKKYLKSMASGLKPRSPNSHVSPSRGSITIEALIPAFTFSICFLSWINFVPSIRYITKINTTVFICIKEQKNWRIILKYILTFLILVTQSKLIRIPKSGKFLLV